MRSAVNDFEILRAIVHPVAVFVMNMLTSFEPPTELQFHYEAVQPDGSVASLPTGVSIPMIVVDARTAAIDDNVFFYFDLAFVRNSEIVHSDDDSMKQRFFKVELGDVFYHTLLVIDEVRKLVDDLPFAKQVTVMLAAVCHDFGKPATTEFIEGHWRSRAHDEAGVRPTHSFLDRLNIHTLDGYDVRAQVVELVRAHLKPGEFYKKRVEVDEGAFRRLARRCELELLYRVARADSLGRNAPWVPREKWYGAEAQEWFIARARELAVESHPPKEILMGRHLLEMGLPESPRIGEIVKAVYELQLDGQVRTLEEAKEAARRIIDASVPEDPNS